jgi:hypothetical protein
MTLRATDLGFNRRQGKLPGNKETLFYEEP